MGLNSFEAAAEAAADNDKRSTTEDEVQALQTLSPRRSALGTFAQTPIEACAAPDETQQPAPVPHLLWRCANGAARLPMVKLRAWARIEHGMAWTRLWQDQVRPGCSGSGRSGFPASRSARIPLNCRRAAEFGGSTRFYTDLVGCLQIVDSRNVVQMRLRICICGRIDGT